MKKYKVRAKEICFLREITVESESKSDAEEAYMEKWLNGEIDVCNSDLDIEAEEVING